MDISCRTISLGHVLIDYALDAVILIAHGDSDGGDEDGQNGVRSLASAKSGGYCAAKTTPIIKISALRMLQQPLMPATPVR